MTITAKIIADSVSPQGIRLTTMQLRYPKFIHGEAKTHRLLRIGDKAYEFLEEVGFMDDPNLSRNASSSRAIPVERLIADVTADPAMPVFWGKNQRGMQAVEELTGTALENAKDMWLAARDAAVGHATALHALGPHKQIVNRIIEPWCHINVVVTASEWTNFFALRRHADAQPEMKALADVMWEAQQASIPVPLEPGQWHLPYISGSDRVDLGFVTDSDMPVLLIKLSVARCARVSYLTQEGKIPSIKEDLALYERLVGSTPLHASPAEHQATPDIEVTPDAAFDWLRWQSPEQHGNLVGWRQFRKFLED